MYNLYSNSLTNILYYNNNNTFYKKKLLNKTQSNHLKKLGISNPFDDTSLLKRINYDESFYKTYGILLNDWNQSDKKLLNINNTILKGIDIIFENFKSLGTFQDYNNHPVDKSFSQQKLF